ncbi:MAG: 50S ribosomal protein L24 [Candidatus Berkelbacteria bacterium]|nr:50S ribosomal protein L24 [Candidatus Berkelbacteria bacterium]
MKLKKGDQVLITTGKDKGKKGKIGDAFSKTNKIIVSGINIVKKHTKATKKNPHGGVVQVERPLFTSNVALICPRCEKPTRIGYKILEKDKKLRICKKCKESVEQ